MKEKNIVILGGGFGGLRVALDLEKYLGKGYKIILVDQNTFHLYTASLYEVASGELSHRSVLIPFSKILKGKEIEFVNAKITRIDPEAKMVETRSKDRFPYWKLVVALGADTEDFGIPGVSEHGIGLKSVTDAEEIHRELLRCSVVRGRPIKVVVGGGGFTGVETAGELTGFKHCPLEITVVEAAPRLLPGMPERVSKAVAKRLNFLGVKVVTSSPIKKIAEQTVTLAGGRELPFDALLWTAGVRGSRLLDPKVFPLDKKKALVVNRNLQVKGFPDVFTVGDLASTGVAWTATKAEIDAKVVAENIASLARGREKKKEYKVFEPPLIVPAGRGWAIAKIGSLIIEGRLASILKDFVLLYYLLTVISPWEAVKIWWKGEYEVIMGTPSSGHRVR
ncbi:FAD-dependent oxidoreductase [Candidatus Saccharibacteria bacterium]|nr:FAD-dependent oxidoreductase [Candidatus Saccharibacteria bacterium]